MIKHKHVPYIEALRRVSTVLRRLYPLLSRGHTEISKNKDLIINGLRYILEALIILKGHQPSSLELTNVAAQALDIGAITNAEYSLIVDLNVRIRVGEVVRYEEIYNLLISLLTKLEHVDPYVRRDLRLFSY